MTGDRLLDPGGPAVTPAESAARRAGHVAAQATLFDAGPEEPPASSCAACGERGPVLDSRCRACVAAGRTPLELL